MEKALRELKVLLLMIIKLLDFHILYKSLLKILNLIVTNLMSILEILLTNIKNKI